MTQPTIIVTRESGSSFRRPDVLHHPVRYVAQCNGMIIVTGETAQAIANYMVAMQLDSYWDVRP
jgi:hypothetical protein